MKKINLIPILLIFSNVSIKKYLAGLIGIILAFSTVGFTIPHNKFGWTFKLKTSISTNNRANIEALDNWEANDPGICSTGEIKPCKLLVPDAYFHDTGIDDILNTQNYIDGPHEAGDQVFEITASIGTDGINYVVSSTTAGLITNKGN